MRIRLILKLPALVALLFGLSAATADAGSVIGLPLGPPFGPAPQLTLTDGLVTNDGTNLSITLNFKTPIAAPVDALDNSAFGFLFLDTDQNPQTGPSLSQLDGALGLDLGKIPSGQVPSRLGADYVVDLDSVGSSVPGQVDVLSGTSLLTLGSVPIAYQPQSLNLSIPLALLTDPVAVNSSVYFGAIIGNPQGPTDTLQGVPEPPALVLAGLAVACVGLYMWAHRRIRCRTG